MVQRREAEGTAAFPLPWVRYMSSPPCRPLPAYKHQWIYSLHMDFLGDEDCLGLSFCFDIHKSPTVPKFQLQTQLKKSQNKRQCVSNVAGLFLFSRGFVTLLLPFGGTEIVQNSFLDAHRRKRSNQGQWVSNVSGLFFIFDRQCRSIHHLWPTTNDSIFRETCCLQMRRVGGLGGCK